MFIGRETELKELHALFNRKSANLVILKGRRRIGKSALIAFFARGHLFYNLTGLPPHSETTKQSQLDEFARQLSIQTGLPEVKVDDWSKLFLLLAEKTKKGRVIILLDEISWMGSKDPDFLGKLKNAWDNQFKENPELILILCGSVSSWIEKNIINSTGFLGRPTLYMTLDELPLHDCNLFWDKQGKYISAYEKLKLLSITGGIPRYLELIVPSISAEENIKRLCFLKNGPLVNEFIHIFSDIFSKRAGMYKRIVEKLILSSLTADELCDALKMTRTGTFDDYLNDLVLAGFLSKDHTWHLKTGIISKMNRYRLKDNYIRFYLKYIAPNKAKIEKNHYNEISQIAFPGWNTILGLQFENVVLNNHSFIIRSLGINPSEIIYDNPFFQRPTTRQQGCQIDYLIQTRFDTLYICEIKFSREPIKNNILSEMQEKIRRLKVPSHISRRPVLIHVNGVSEEVIESQYFSHIINFSDLLTNS